MGTDEPENDALIELRKLSSTIERKLNREALLNGLTTLLALFSSGGIMVSLVTAWMPSDWVSPDFKLTWLIATIGCLILTGLVVAVNLSRSSS